jgi:hypothetical protein
MKLCETALPQVAGNRYGGKKWEYNEKVHQLFTDFKKAYDSIRRKVRIVQYSHTFWVTHEIS